MVVPVAGWMFLLVVVLVAIAAVTSLVVDVNRSRSIPFSFRPTSALPAQEVRDYWVLGVLARDLRYDRFRVASQTPGNVVFARTWRPLAAWVLTVMVFPLGLILLILFERVSIVSVILVPTGSGGTEILVCGQARSRVIEGIDHRLREDFAPTLAAP